MDERKDDTIDSHGSVEKTNHRSAKARAVTRPQPKWRTAEIAYDENGNIVVLNVEVAKTLRAQMRADRLLEVGFPERNMSVKGDRLEEDPPPGTRGGIRPTNNQCQCGSLRLQVVAEDVPFRNMSPLF